MKKKKKKKEGGRDIFCDQEYSVLRDVGFPPTKLGCRGAGRRARSYTQQSKTQENRYAYTYISPAAATSLLLSAVASNVPFQAVESGWSKSHRSHRYYNWAAYAGTLFTIYKRRFPRASSDTTRACTQFRLVEIDDLYCPQPENDAPVMGSASAT